MGWLKGFASTFNPAGSINMGLQWKERREAQKKIEDAEKEFKVNAQKYATKFDEGYKDGIWTPEERSSMALYTMVLGDHFRQQWTEFEKSYTKMEKEQIDFQIEEISSSLKLYTDFDIKDTSALLENLERIANESPYESVKIRANYAMKSIQSKMDMAPEPKAETWTSYAEAQAANPKMEIKFNASKGVYYVAGEKAPEKEYEFEAKMEEADKALDRGELSLAEWKQIRIRLLGGSAPIPGGKTIPISLLESTRSKMEVAETWEGKGGAKEILMDLEGAKYSTEQVGVHKEEWTRERTAERKEDIELTIGTLEDMLDEGGTFRPTEEYELGVGEGKTDTKTKFEWYKTLYEQLQRELDRLSKLGVDVSRFKKAIPPEKLKTLGFGLDIMGKKQMKDIETIWQ